MVIFITNIPLEKLKKKYYHIAADFYMNVW